MGSLVALRGGIKTGCGMISNPGLFPSRDYFRAGFCCDRVRPGPYGRIRLRQTFVATTASIAAIFGRIRRIPAAFECLPTPCCRNV
jgi:hypothetical protein